MPKKTKEEKRKAAQRKYQLFFKEQNVPEIRQKIQSNSPLELPTSQSAATQKKVDTTASSYFMKDLMKSLTLISAIIALEIILYYGTINNYFSFLNFK